MTPIRALIAEDEPLLAMALAGTLRRLWPELEIVAMAENGVAAVQKTLDERPDVLFLDIKMPGKTGLEAAQELADAWGQGAQDGAQTQPFPLVVFVTAYDEFALAAFEQAAVDYVCKPVSDERLGKTVERLKSRLAARLQGPRQTGGADEGLARMLAQLDSLRAPRLSMIRAAVGNQVRMIPIDDVVYFEATDKYVTVATGQGDSLIRTSLKELLPQLDPERFWQIHRGTVVNARCIAAAVRDEAGKLSLRLHGRSETLAVSRLFAHLFRQM
ncbi:LytTR family DNA-binding domain-containing protein [Janthinobacterium sp. 17J80-10]|uniref:LytR/AlgR family response regulator transcription factor n=1 Tax=Janthinobacterium sp. 17J80-10 TaxID=2497863 RepID=UPI0010056156|nr:LytTR family DNA-binding domain-containing protein [Janthinobacterium sp. 17J80-10]QAU33766.1 response regulator transcription factor [Janthinobacterium sp. 17J80-10]